jgi:eukaryotic-like serine/threonine-protein kinase
MSGDSRGDFSGSTVGGGRYRLSSLLGEGGMASVHAGHDTVLDRSVAIKTLHSDLGRESSFRERFRREAQAVARLNHTNIVSVFDSGEDEIDGRSIPYIVMELVDGDPLRTALDRDVAAQGAMPTERALKITGDVLAALSASHEMGLVHRDIKPGNVMLTKRGVVKVMDFGIARALQSGVTSMTQTGMVVGTPQYLSPEQALGRGVDERSDLYSVGCMLFELVTGRLPFDGDSPLAVAYQHVQQEPPVPSTINRSLPPAVDALIARALRKNPAERFPTADAMREECERVASGGGAAATPLVIGEGPVAHHGYPTGAGPDAFAVFPNAGSGTGPNGVPGQAGGLGGSLGAPLGPSLGAPLGAAPLGAAPRGAEPHTPTPYPNPVQAPIPATRPPMAAQAQGNFGPPTPQPGPVPQQYAPVGYQTAAPGRPPIGPGYATRPAMPQQRTGGNWKPLLIFSAIAVVAILILLIIVGALTDGDGSKANGSHSPSPNISYGDQSRTLQSSECTNAGDFSDSSKDVMPDLSDKYIDSVEQCVKAAGWSFRIKHVNEQVFGKGTVVDQEPDAYAEFDPKKTTITLMVSTGRTDG